jgi:branched-chain amino acid transport system ATP-binding protein
MTTTPADVTQKANRGVRPAALEIRSLVVGYGQTAVVQDASLRVEAGQVVALLGPNGAGKTTTLLAISGFLRPFSGEVLVHGEPVTKGRPRARARLGIAHVCEDRALFSGMTVSQNLKLGRRRTRADTLIFDETMDVFPALRSVLARQAGLLSGGEQQMLALARAMLGKPEILMIDEMSHGLAPLIVDHLLTAVRTAADKGTAVLVVEQHVQMALSIADRAYVFDRGHLRSDLTLEQLRASTDELGEMYLGKATVTTQ